MSADGNAAVNLADQTLEHLTRADFNKLGAAVGNHVLDGLGPTNGGSQLSNEVSLDFSGVSMRLGVNVLIDRT